MNEIAGNISIGVIGGLVTTLFVVVLRSIWVNIILPWFEEKIYKDAKIEGTWKGAYKNGACGDEVIKINQSSHRITGTMTCISGPDKGQVYQLEGEFKNLILTASYSSREIGSLDRGSITLMLKNNGHELTGHCSYYSDEEHNVVDAEYTWLRNGK